MFSDYSRFYSATQTLLDSHMPKVWYFTSRQPS